MTPSLFGPAATFGVGGYPVGLAAGDFTGQGLPDLVAVNQGDTSISILLNHGGGSFTSGETISFGSFLAYAVTGDFTGNGKIDIAVTDESGGTVDVLLGNGDGTFQAPRSFAAGRTPYTLATGDFTNDGKLDLVVVNGPTVSFLKGNGDGTFQAPQAIVNLGSAGAAQNVAVADLNNDGNSDVVVTVNSYSGTGGSLLVLLGHGNGTFTLAENYASTTGYSGVAVGDFNRDGKPDVAATGLNGKVAVYMGGGDGSLQNTDSYAVAGGPSYAIAAADFNADGATDLVTANSGNNTVSVLLCRTDGKFVLEGTYPVAYSPEDVIVADLNRDGLPDLAVTGGTANVSVLMNQYAYHTLLTFDDVPSGTVINNQYPGVTLSQRVSGALPGVYAQTPPLGGPGRLLSQRNWHLQQPPSSDRDELRRVLRSIRDRASDLFDPPRHSEH